MSTYGIGKELDETQWRSVYRQLLVRGLLAVDWEAHGALRLTDAARPLLRGEQTVLLRRDEISSDSGKTRRSAAAVPDSVEARLLEALRALRRQLAEEQGVALYAIFLDGALTQMAQQRPQTLEELAKITGMGERKLTRYGNALLAVLRQFGPAPASSAAINTARLSLQLLLQGLSVAEIATRRDLAPSTVWGHLAQAIEESLLDYREIKEITEEQIEAITDAWLSLPIDEQSRLKPLYEVLNGEYEYPILRCVVAGLRREAGQGEM